MSPNSTMVTSDRIKETATPRSRQRPGLACEACRQRKLRCDRQTPCGSCVDAGMECYVDSNRPPRGPKKGHLKELRSRLATLERTISLQEAKACSPASENTGSDSTGTTEDVIFNHMAVDAFDTISFSDIFTPKFDFTAKVVVRSPEELGALNSPLPALMRADLNQLFFDRVYFFTPIIQQSRFMTWANQPWPSEYHACLQYAVWTLAASLSSQFQSTKESLYMDTRRMMLTLEMEDNPFEDCNHLEHIQALLLIATYEFMQNSFSRAWESAGKAFRLVQLMKLHRVDSLCPTDNESMIFTNPDSWAVIEEKRRGFWLAFCLDRLLCGVNGLPLTFSEDVICTRLPAPEASFQGDVVSMMPFLADIMETKEMTPLDAVVDTIIFSALWGRVLSQKQDFKFDQPTEHRKASLWQSHASLGNVISQRTDAFLQRHPLSKIESDSSLLFNRMMAMAIILVHRQVAESIPNNTNEQQQAFKRYREEAQASAQQLVMLSKHLYSLSLLKIHPFTPVPLFHCAIFLAGRNGIPTGDSETEIRDLIAVVRELQQVNPFCKTFLDRFNNTTCMGLFNSIA